MTIESIPENAPCPLKTGRVTRKTGKRLAAPSANAPAIAAKAVPPIPTAALATANPIPLPEVASSLPSPTSTMNPETANPTTSAPGVSDATPPMTPSTMPEPESAALALSATTDSPPCLNGKKPNKALLRRKQFQMEIRNDETKASLYQVRLATYKPYLDRVDHSVEVWGSSRGRKGEFETRTTQIAAYCQTQGLNDPNATPKQLVAQAACLLKGTEVYDIHLGDPNGKPECKKHLAKTFEETSAFFGLGTKAMIKARNGKGNGKGKAA